MTKNLNIQYKYVKIDLLDFAVFEDLFDFSNSEVTVDTGIQFEYNKDQQIIACRIDVSYSQDANVVLRSSMVSYFMVHPDSLSLLVKDNSIVFPINFLVQLASLNYGSMRGAINIKTSNTPFNSYILPPLYIQEIIKNSLVVNL